MGSHTFGHIVYHIIILEMHLEFQVYEYRDLTFLQHKYVVYLSLMFKQNKSGK